MVSTILNTLALAASAAALTNSAAGVQSGCYYNVAGVGNFNYHFSDNFTTSSTLSSDLSASIYSVNAGTAPWARRFDITNMGYNSSTGALTLAVPGGQTSGPISSAQLVTSFSDILFGSVRTVAMVSKSAGTTHGFTFYSNDTQEIDFAFITADTSLVHLTNEATNASLAASTVSFAAPSDATTKFHEYRVDWTASASTFYIDAVLVATITTNVPSTAGFWVWNNWSNGNTWAAGPPTADSTLQIQSIEGYVNRTSVADSISSGATVCKVSSSSSSSSVASSTKTSSTLSTSSVVSTSSAKSSSVSSSTAAPVTTAAAAKVSSSSSSVKSSSTSSSASSTATGLAGASCGTFFTGADDDVCATGYTCTMTNILTGYTCTASTTVNTSKNNAKSS